MLLSEPELILISAVNRVKNQGFFKGVRPFTQWWLSINYHDPENLRGSIKQFGGKVVATTDVFLGRDTNPVAHSWHLVQKDDGKTTQHYRTTSEFQPEEGIIELLIRHNCDQKDLEREIRRY